MSVTFVEVWTLRRGIIDPPEPVMPSVQIRLQRDYIYARFERDPPFTEAELWQYEGSGRARYRTSYGRTSHGERGIA
jgi:hypothetical protein